MGISVDIGICRSWWDRGGRAWHHSVDIPSDVPEIEAKISAQWVVSLDNAKLEVMASGVSGRTKDKIRHVCEGLMVEWLRGVDLSVLNV